jgi:hypothetical protein
MTTPSNASVRDHVRTVVEKLKNEQKEPSSLKAAFAELDLIIVTVVMLCVAWVAVLGWGALRILRGLVGL